MPWAVMATFETPDADPLVHYCPGVDVTAGAVRLLESPFPALD